MAIVTISRGTFSGGRLLADALARQMGCACLDSDDLADAAGRLGVPVARLKAAMSSTPSFRRSLSRERQMYLACITVTLGERAMDGDLVYHGHAAHLLLPGVTHVVRVRVTADLEHRVRSAMERLRTTRNEARKYILSVDADRARWVDFLYGIDWSDSSHYDLVVNLEHVSVSHAAGVLRGLAGLREFRPTPGSLQQLRDVLLAARARVRLGLDPRTADADVEVKANRGVLNVVHQPRQVHLAPLIHEVLSGLEDARGVQCTIASSTVLWIEEGFAPDSSSTSALGEMARRQDAAIELLRMEPEAREREVPSVAPGVRVELPQQVAEHSGVVFGEQGLESVVSLPGDHGTTATVRTLRRRGRAAGWRALPRDRVPEALDPNAKYGLVVLGDVYQNQPDAVRSRLRRELRAALGRRLHVPVVMVEQVTRRLSFGVFDGVGLAAAVATLVAFYWLVFSHQPAVLEFFGKPVGWAWLVLRVAALLVVMPALAGLGARVVGLVGRAMRID